MSTQPAQAAPKPSFVRYDAVTKSYGAKGGALALRATSLDIAEGEFICVVGPSGCGKTTLLNMLAGFVKPTTGRVSIGDVPVAEPGPDRGVVFQEAGLFDWLTARRNVEFGLKMSGVPQKERQLRADEVLKLTGMLRFADRYPSQLSGGMKQRIGIARALVNDPAVLLMDEPFAALDAQSRSLMQEELLSVWRRTGKTILFVTHSVDEAIYLADRVVVMSANPGRIKADIRIEIERPRDEMSLEFNRLKRELKEMVMFEARQQELEA